MAQALAAEGGTLRLLARPGGDPKRLEGLPGEAVAGDLTRPESLRTAIAECEAVVHVAADYRLRVKDPAEMYRANVDGTKELLRLARANGVRRVVYCSSVATLGFKADGSGADVDVPVTVADMVSHYKRSKFLAEVEALQAAQDGQAVIVLNPTAPIGSHDAKPTPTGRIIVDFLQRRFPAYTDTGLNLVDVREVARSHVAALTRGTPGRRYVLGGENLTLKKILDGMAALTGLPSPSLRLPHAVAALYAWFEEAFTERVRGREPRTTREEVRMSRKKMWVASDRAVQELGHRVVPVQPALQAAIEWFWANGYAPKP